MSDPNRPRPVFDTCYGGPNTDPEHDARWCARFFDICASSGEVFRKPDGRIWICSRRRAPYPILDVAEFSPQIRNCVRIVKRNERTQALEDTDLPIGAAKLLFHSDMVSRLPLVRAVVYDPVVIYTKDGPTLSTAGYTPATQTYYWVSDDSEPITPRAGIEHIERCFSAIPFKNAAQRSNYFAWLLGGVILDRRLNAPLMVIDGNQRNIGKSSIQSAAGIILTGMTKVPINSAPTEFEKQLGTRFIQGDRFISLDNIVTERGKSYKNEPLARHLTSGWSARVRVLGVSREIEQTGVLFTLTANDARIDEDLTTRSLSVALYAAQSKRMDPYCVDYALKHRREIYGELLTLALSTNPPDQSYTNSPHFRFRGWLSVVEPTCQRAFGPLDISEVSNFDDAFTELFGWGADHAEKTFSTSELLETLRSSPDTFFALRERILTKPSTRGQAIVLGTLLKAYAGHRYSFTPDSSVFLDESTKTDKGAPRYRFVLENKEPA